MIISREWQSMREMNLKTIGLLLEFHARNLIQYSENIQYDLQYLSKSSINKTINLHRHLVLKVSLYLTLSHKGHCFVNRRNAHPSVSLLSTWLKTIQANMASGPVLETLRTESLPNIQIAV